MAYCPLSPILVTLIGRQILQIGHRLLSINMMPSARLIFQFTI